MNLDNLDGLIPMTTNDDAERCGHPIRSGGTCSLPKTHWPAPATERRATVERYDPVLRRLVAALGDPGGINIGTEMEPQSALVLDDWDEFDQALDAALATLDAEAER